MPAIINLNFARKSTEEDEMTSIWLKQVKRCVESLLLQYPDASASRKCEILLSLREEYHSLPERYQLQGNLHDLQKHWNGLRDLWWRLHAILKAEEEAANGTAS